MKKIFISAAVVAASVFGFYTANQNIAMANLSALEMENLELLAEGEPGSMIDHMWSVGNNGSNGGSQKEWPCPGQPIEWDPTTLSTVHCGYDCFCKKITYSVVVKRCY